MNPKSEEIKQFFLEIKEKLTAMGYDPDDIDINIETFIYVSIQEEIKEAYYEFEQNCKERKYAYLEMSKD
jgi:hypothetical protein